MHFFNNSTWRSLFTSFFESDRGIKLVSYLATERTQHTVFPPEELVFRALELTDFEQVKVVILGQDPYHNIGQAQGLSFSVPEGIPLPPSLKNIFAELTTDIANCPKPKSGDLTAWAQQGVLLLNATLTVRAHTAGSHQKKGWEEFTDAIIQRISNELDHVVFILWGGYAQKKSALIDKNKHLILSSVHPSPLSVYRGFFGSKPFSQANDYLIAHKKTPIDWRLNHSDT